MRRRWTSPPADGINVVTSGSDDAAALYGGGRLPDRDTRYGRADEFLTAVKQLWDSWEPGALIANPAAGVIVDDSLAPPLEFVGKHISFTARFQFPRSVQGRPAIVQAGGSPQGIELAAKHADAVFCQANTIPAGQEFYRTLKDRAAAHGRDPDEILVLPGLNITLGGTEEEAETRRAELVATGADEPTRLRAFANILGVPADLLRLDSAPPWDYIDGPEWSPRSIGGAKAILDVARRETLTVRELLERGADAQRALVGTPEQVADSIGQWFTQRAADGFNLNFDVFPSGLEHIVDQLVPELQRRGIFRKDYESTTLRGHYGLPAHTSGASRATAASA